MDDNKLPADNKSEALFSEINDIQNEELYRIEGPQEEFHHSKLGVHAFQLWKKDVFTDVIIKLGGKCYKAHRPVLSCYSKYFKKRIPKHGNNIIKLDRLSITQESFEKLLRYMYTGNIDITVRNIGDLYQASQKLGMKKTLVLCQEIFTGKVNRDAQCIYLFVTAKNLNELEAAKKAFKKMVLHFEQIAGTKEFLDLNFDEVTKFLSCDQLATRSEILVYLAALKWITYEFLEREIYIKQVMACVRFPLMSLTEIMSCFSPPLLPGVVEMPSLEYMLLKATCCIASKNVGDQILLKKYSRKPRQNSIEPQSLILWDSDIFNPSRHSQYRQETAATTIQSGYRAHVAHCEKRKMHYLRDMTKKSKAFKETHVDQIVRINVSRGIVKKVSDTKLIFQNMVTKIDHTIKDLANVKPYVAGKIIIEKELPSKKLCDAIDATTNAMMNKTKKNEAFKLQNEKIRNVGKKTSLETSSSKSSLTFHRIENSVSEPFFAIKNQQNKTKNEFISKSSESHLKNKEPFHVQFAGVKNRYPVENKYSAPILKTVSEDKNLAETIESSPEFTETGNIERNMRNKVDEKRIILLGGYDPNNIENTFIGRKMIEYDPVKDKWTHFGYMPVSRHHTCAVYYDSCIYVIGGSDMTDESVISELPTNICLKFEIKKNIWIMISAMWTSRIYHGVAAIEDTIYAVGGVDENSNILDSIEQYNIKQNEWHFLDCKLKVPRLAVGVCAYEGKLWIAGGMNYDMGKKIVDVFAEVEIYNPSTDDMDISVANLPNPRAYVALVECDKQLYCIGGAKHDKIYEENICSVNDVYVYSKDLDMWVAVKPLPNRGHSVSAISFGGVIYVINGLSIRENVVLSEDVLIYDPEKNTWTTCSPLPDVLDGLCAVCVPAEICDMMKGKKEELPTLL